jgi:predicted nucleotidyltransferase
VSDKALSDYYDHAKAFDHQADALLYSYASHDYSKESDADLRARLRYVTGKEHTETLQKLEEVAARYGLKRRDLKLKILVDKTRKKPSEWENSYLGKYKPFYGSDL